MYFVLDFSVQGSKNRINWLNQFDLTTLTPKELSLCGDYILYGDEQLEKARCHVKQREIKKDAALHNIQNSTLFADNATGELSNASEEHTEELVKDIDSNLHKRDPYMTNEKIPAKIIINTKYDDLKRNRIICSLDALLMDKEFNEDRLLENPIRYKTPRPKLDKDKLTQIPGIQALWQSIENLQKQLDKQTDRQKRYYLRHQIIDLRTYQYFLYDCYYPTTKLSHKGLSPKAYVPQCYKEMEYPILPRGVAKDLNDKNFLYPRKSKDHIEEYKVPQKGRYIDFTNPEHIRWLIKYKELIEEQADKDIESPLKNLIYTFEIYVKLSQLTPREQFILDARIQGIQNSKLPKLFLKKFGYTHQDNYFSTLYSQLCKKISNTARLNYKEALYRNDKDKWKKCHRCGRWFLRDEGFFVKNGTSKDGLKSVCKFCDKDMRKIREEEKKNG